VDSQTTVGRFLVDVSGAATYLGTSERLVRPLIAERRIASHMGRVVGLDVADPERVPRRESHGADPIRLALSEGGAVWDTQWMTTP
jgi:hypothetical protein